MRSQQGGCRKGGRLLWKKYWGTKRILPGLQSQSFKWCGMETAISWKLAWEAESTKKNWVLFREQINELHKVVGDGALLVSSRKHGERISGVRED